VRSQYGARGGFKREDGDSNGASEDDDEKQSSDGGGLGLFLCGGRAGRAGIVTGAGDAGAFAGSAAATGTIGAGCTDAFVGGVRQ
jgi:hypothetical protein